MSRLHRRVDLSSLATILCAATALSGCGMTENVPRVAVGQPAPSYAAITLEGDSIALRDLKGRVVLLNLWATWCFPCRQEIPELQALHERLAPRGLEVVGVSVDARGAQEPIREFADEFGVTYPIWHDPDSRIINTFLAYGVPTTYLIDRDGMIRWKHLGPVMADDPALVRALEEAL